MANLAGKLKTAPMELFQAATHWVEERFAKLDIFDETKTELQKDSPWYQLGGMYYLAWLVVLTTGVILVALYLPTTAQAFDSISVISENALGHTLRGLHKYGGDAMIIAATLRVYRMWFNAEYKNKGEFTFILSILLLLAAMYSGLTGYLLIWNQRAFWATKVFATFPTFLDITPGNWHWPIPYDNQGHFNLLYFFINGNTWFIPNLIGAVTKLIGNWTHEGMTTSQILTGGSSIGQATMTRFFSLHFGISLILLVTTELYFYKKRLKRLNLKWPAILTVLAMLVFVAIVLPAESGSRANPEVTPLPILSDWYFLALYQMLKYMDPYWATLWTVGVPVVTITLMFLDFGPEKDPWRRPIFTTIAIMAAIEFIVFSLLIIANQANIQRDPPYWYAHIILSISIGQFWHWSLYKQRLPMFFWVLFNQIASTWYLLFWHVIAADNLMLWLTHHTPADFNPTNLYWNFLWFGFSTFQTIIAATLLWMDASAKRRLANEAVLEGAPA